MRYTTLIFMILTACSPGFAVAKDLDAANNALIGTIVIVHLDANSQYTTGTLVEQSPQGVLVRLQATGKLYFYPSHRLSGLEQL